MLLKNGFEKAVGLLPPEMRQSALSLPEKERENVEELRLRTGFPPTFLSRGREAPLGFPRPVTGHSLRCVLELATGASAYSAQESIRQGFLTVRGGLRIGLCGAAVMGEKGVSGLRDLSSISIRIPSERRGCADGLFPGLFGKGLCSALIISPPGLGKTTLLRELVRRVSDAGTRVSLADERAEVAACFEGKPQLDVGKSTDILTGAPKSEAAMMLLRSMNPGLLALDEITAPEDVRVCESASNCGVKLLATAHAADTRDLTRRLLYRELIEAGIFDKAVVISMHNGERRYDTEELR